jgi:methyltransferase family protein
VFPGAAVLYAVVRAMKPGVIVETGVACGISSAHILRALAANRTGTLYSIDLPNVQEGSALPEGCTSGWMVPEALRRRWTLRIGDSRTLLPDLQAFPRLADRGVLMSDDVHLHTAWDDFCAQRDLRPTRIGHLGVMRKRSRP